uniref:Uncharacterized protein n=2 Tax=Ditylum brightwellii TaxID=49249 RepID=A0A7S4VJV7_9STRA
MKPTKKEQDETDEEKPTPTTTAIATPKKRRVVSFRDPATSDDEKNPKSSSLSSPTSIRSGTVQAVHDSSSSSSSTSRKRNRSSLSSSSVSKTRVKLPIFQSGWRSLRYPPAISAPGTKARFADLKARMQSVRSLKSLLVVPLEEDEEEKKAKVSSCVWTDGCGCQWSLLFFPLVIFISHNHHSLPLNFPCKIV